MLFEIDNVFKAIRTGIDLYGGSPPQLTESSLCNACMNMHPDPRSTSLSEPPEKCEARSIEHRGQQTWFSGFGAELENYCVARIPGRYNARFEVYRDLVGSKSSRLSEHLFIGLAYWYLYSPTASLGR
jgi:hypothetical protein